MKLNKAEIDKKQYSTYKAGYNAFAAECAKLSARTLPPARTGAMEQQCKKVLKKARALLRRRPGDDIKRRVEQDCETLHEHLDTIRRAYIAGINASHGCALDADELLDVPYKNMLLKLNIQDVVFQKLVRDLIPAHPRDEFPSARRIRRHFVIHSGTTNTGKTYNALIALKAAETGVYLAPLRLLALQVFQLLNEDGVACTLSTGEEEIITPGAKHISSTIEKLDTDKRYDVAVIDEAQMLADRQRGGAWTRAILGLFAAEIHICCQPNAVNLIKQIISSCHDTFRIVEYYRDTELVFEDKAFTFPSGVERGDALVAFSKRMVLAISGVLAEGNIKSSVIYGNLPPETRRNQMKAFQEGETDVVVSTDAIGMGLNLPVKRVVFMTSTKFDGVEENLLRPYEVKQIAGRAGRKGIYEIGLVNCIEHKAHVKAALEADLGDLTKAYYLPAEEYVLKLPVGDLGQRIIACLNARTDVPWLFKTDIEQPLRLLQKIDKMPLTMRDKYKLIFLPFDAKNDELLGEWMDYVKSFPGSRQLRLPVIRFETLDSLEQYYQSLDLYYSFCKTMDVPFDSQAVIRRKYETAGKIQDLLKERMGSMGRKCRRCGANLPWNHQYGICDRCYSRMRYRVSF